MKLAVITDEIDADLGHALDVMAEYGVQGAELRQLWDKNIAEAPREYWQRAKDLLDARGMQVVGIASPFYKCDLPGVEPEGPAGPLHSASARGLGDQIALLERCMEAADFFGDIADSHLFVLEARAADAHSGRNDCGCLCRAGGDGRAGGHDFRH